MKIARVFIEEYSGRQVGDIHDVIDSENHPGSVREGILKEVPVADEFDPDIVAATIHPECWIKEGAPTVYEDPEDETYTHQTEDAPYVKFTEDADKIAAKAQADKDAQIAVKYNEMNADVMAEMTSVFGTTRPDSATAYHETWKLMAAKPELFSGEGLVAEKDTATYSKGDTLETDLKVQTYANERIAEVETYGVNRIKRIKQFADEKAAILAG